MKYKNFHSQFGEDQWLFENGILPKKGFFVDVGAGDPIKLSNTYFLEKNGWDGICIDADKRQVKKLRAKRKNVVHALINSGVTDYFEERKHSDLSSIDRDGEHRPNTQGITLEKILNIHKIKGIDLLSVDVEGFEIEVLKSLCFFTHKPKIIIIEYITPNKPSQREDIMKWLGILPYDMIHQTQANLIFKINKK